MNLSNIYCYKGNTPPHKISSDKSNLKIQSHVLGKVTLYFEDVDVHTSLNV